MVLLCQSPLDSHYLRAVLEHRGKEIIPWHLLLATGAAKVSLKGQQEAWVKGIEMQAVGSQAGVSQIGKGKRLGRGTGRACDTYLRFQTCAVRILSCRDTRRHVLIWNGRHHCLWMSPLFFFFCRITICIQLFSCSVHLHGLVKGLHSRALTCLTCARPGFHPLQEIDNIKFTSVNTM